jgi:hypothetical protein
MKTNRLGKMVNNNILKKEKEIQLRKKNIMQRGNIKKYSLSDKYRVGQKIYHPVFKDIGKVIRRRKSRTGNLKKIIVKFERVGEKTLIEDIEEAK